MDGLDVLAGRYRLLDRLGTGGMSVVWRGYDEVLGRDVAVKVLSGQYATDEGSRDLIRAEAKVAASLSHPHLVNVHDYGEQALPGGGRVPFLVMELAEGPSLADRLAGGRLPWRAAVRMCAEVAAGLAAMHERGLVHRDVKPANVMLTRAGAKVVDFGIAAVAGDDADRCPDGLLLGTPAYLAPERVAGGVVTPATDVYAVGLLLYRALTGILPWSAATVTGMIRAHCYAEPAPMPAVDGLPAQVRQVCCRCLAKDPANRPGSAEIARALRAAAGEPLGQPAPTLRIPAGAGAGAGAGVGVGVGVGTGGRPGRRGRTAAAAVVVSVLAAGLPAASQPHRAGSSAPAACAVRYQTQRDVDGVFAVDVTVTNTGTRPVTGQTLTFDFPGRQQITNSDGWTQAGRLVRSTAGAVPLPPHAAVTLHLTGTHPDDNPLPTEFALDGADCTAQVSGATSTADTSDQNTGADRSQVAPPPGPAAVAPPDDSNPAGNSRDNDKGKAKGKRK